VEQPDEVDQLGLVEVGDAGGDQGEAVLAHVERPEGELAVAGGVGHGPGAAAEAEVVVEAAPVAFVEAGEVGRQGGQGFGGAVAEAAAGEVKAVGVGEQGAALGRQGRQVAAQGVVEGAWLTRRGAARTAPSRAGRGGARRGRRGRARAG
jgi:hypothetical protein